MAAANLNLCIGVDIGRSSIKAVLLERSGAQRTCLGYHVFVVPDGQTMTPGVLSQGLQQVAQVFGGQTNRATLVSGDREILLKFFEKPPMAKDALDQVVGNEMKALATGAGDTADPNPPGYRYAVVGISKVESTTTQHILTASVSPAWLRDKVDLFKQAGLDLVGIFPFPIALRECFWANYGPDLQEKEPPYLVALVDFGFNTNQVVVCDRNILRLARSFPFAGDELTQSLVRSFKVDGQELTLDRNMAEAYKAQVGMLSSEELAAYLPEALEPQVSDTIRRGVDRMTQKLRLSLDYFKGQMKSQVSQAYIFGGGANLRGLTDGLAEYLMVQEAAELSPFLHIHFAPADPAQKDPDPGLRNLLVPAVGAALAAYQDDQSTLNLLSIIRVDPWIEWKHKVGSHFLPLALAAASVLVPLVYGLGVFWPEYSRYSGLQKECAALQTEMTQYTSSKGQLDTLSLEERAQRLRIRFVQDMLGRRIFWSRVLLDLTALLPETVWLDDLSTPEFFGDTGSPGGGGGKQEKALPPNSIRLKGRSISYAALSTFMQKLEGTQVFRGISWEESKRTSRTAKGEIQFSLTCQVFPSTKGSEP